MNNGECEHGRCELACGECKAAAQANATRELLHTVLERAAMSGRVDHVAMVASASARDRMATHVGRVATALERIAKALEAREQ